MEEKKIHWWVLKNAYIVLDLSEMPKDWTIEKWIDYVDEHRMLILDTGKEQCVSKVVQLMSDMSELVDIYKDLAVKNNEKMNKDFDNILILNKNQEHGTKED